MSENLIRETLYGDWGQFFCVDKELIRIRSHFQEITIFENKSFGRTMVLDGVVQITEKDQYIYQEMISHVPLLEHGKAERILIIGAGDGGVLRHVLQHNSVKKVVMVEIDDKVIELSKKFLSAISEEAWNDPRAEILIEDGIAYVKSVPSLSFDVIIVDSTDPIGIGEVLFTEEFYQNCSRILTKNGIIVNQCGVPFMQTGELHQISFRLAKFFAHVTAYVVAVPTYIGGFMTLGFACKERSFVPQSVETITKRAESLGIRNKSYYWSPEVHKASFCLPPYILSQLPPQEN